MADDKGSYVPVQVDEIAESPSPVAVAAVEGSVSVVAPATLPEGYRFEVQTGNKNDAALHVEVPKGGVVGGQQFTGATVNVGNGASGMEVDGQSSSARIPVGHWRDGLCNFCGHGPFHPHCWLGWIFGPCLLAQVMVRLNLDLLTNRRPNPNAPNPAFKIVLGIYLASILICLIHWPLVFIIVHLLGIYMFVATWFTRQAMRKQYAIPEQDCKGCEDFCCAYFCHCCVAMQMARHTANYDVENAALCTDNGLAQSP